MALSIRVSDPSFPDIRKTGALYVDKTQYLYRMISSDKMFFCARPRRFGKTLLVSTLEAIFQGKRELFKGLYIDSTNYDWKTYPVVHIDFGGCESKNGNELAFWLKDILSQCAASYGKALDLSRPLHMVFANLITALAGYENNVVILIDEYDRVISDNLYNPELSNLQQVLSSFYSTIKACFSKLRFVFLTGVTKYAKLSVFSGMNNLRDISMSDDYAAMFGYTQEELEQNFAPYIKRGMENSGMYRDAYLAKVKDMYDGYKFSPYGETVYNPVSVGSFFDDGGRTFRGYWADTGNTTLLMDVARKVNFNLASDLEGPVSDSFSFDITRLVRSDVSSSELKWLLYQTGYLTISRIRPSGSVVLYYLAFPNMEVAQAFSSNLLTMYAGDKTDGGSLLAQMMDGLERHDLPLFMDNLKGAYASLPYPTKPWEFTFSMVLGTVLYFCDPSRVASEFQTSEGRADMVFRLEKRIYLFELKVDQGADIALQQIKDKHYADRFKTEGKPIHLVGISFSSEKRNISGWKEETIEA